jgi:hypothetical protein
MPDLIRHPVFLMDVACASEDTCSRALEGIRVFAGMTDYSLITTDAVLLKGFVRMAREKRKG